MKKIVLTIFTTSLLASSLLATDKSAIYLNISNSELNSNSYTEFGFGQKINFNTESKILFGLNYGLNFGQVESKLFNKTKLEKIDVTTIDFDIKVGYKVIKNLELFTLGSGSAQYINSNMAYGFGYGAGISYDITKKLEVTALYKMMNMNLDIGGSYDYTRTTAQISYKF